MATDIQTIVIVGGGFAGTTLARVLDGKLPPGHELLLISEESHTTFNPMLPEALGASIFPEQVVAPHCSNSRSHAKGTEKAEHYSSRICR